MTRIDGTGSRVFGWIAGGLRDCGWCQDNSFRVNRNLTEAIRVNGQPPSGHRVGPEHVVSTRTPAPAILRTALRRGGEGGLWAAPGRRSGPRMLLLRLRLGGVGGQETRSTRAGPVPVDGG